jgi:hypothetical protein
MLNENKSKIFELSKLNESTAYMLRIVLDSYFVDFEKREQSIFESRQQHHQIFSDVCHIKTAESKCKVEV